MNSSQNTSLNDRPAIHITDSTTYDDGSVSLNYVCNQKALEQCAEELEKDIKDLTKDEIHRFISKNVGSALMCHNGWKLKQNS